MKTLTQGANTALDGGRSATVDVRWSPANIGGADVDASAFLLDAAGKVRSDADFVFYNQPSSSDGSVRVSGTAGHQVFSVDLAAVPSSVEKIAFAVTIHGNSSFASAQSVEFVVADTASYVPKTDAMAESALIVAELYRRNATWKVRAVGQGFEGGLGPLATYFGVDIADESAGTDSGSASDTGKVRLEKKLVSLEKQAPELVSLVKKVQLSLEKKQVSRDRAKVALCLDISASMHHLFKSGKIDTLVKRVMAMAYRFDDDGEIDVFLFGAKSHEYGTVDVSSYRTFVSDMLAQYPLEGGTRYGAAMGLVREFYAADTKTRTLPIYVMFVTDGATMDKDRAIREIKEASKDPIFWQFMAIGKKPKKKRGLFGRILGSGFDFLEQLDDMPGREVDNADFFLVEDPAGPSDEEMFDLMMDEYPDWLKLVSAKGILKS